jgi:hypothetical protein
MKADSQIAEPFLFNPMKHHLGFLKEFIENNIRPPVPQKGDVISQSLKHIGSTVMDIYAGPFPISKICDGINNFLIANNLTDTEKYSRWTGRNPESYRVIALSDESEWTLKFNDDHSRYVHIFPARNSRYTFRVKGNTLKSALIYLILIGKDMITAEDLNEVRQYIGLSPVKDAIDAEAIVEMIEILRG